MTNPIEVLNGLCRVGAVYLILGLPALPRFVVIRTTPFEPLEP